MNMLIVNSGPLLRLECFLGVFLVMAIWEFLAPRRPLAFSRLVRWSNNMGLTAFNALLVSLVFPAAAAGVALHVEKNGWGILQVVSIGDWSKGFVAIIMLDLVIYTQHVLFHKIPILWRLHRMHHTDLDVDVTTGARFHPGEILLSMGIKMGAVMVIGSPAWSVIVFEILLNGTSMFNHSDIYMPTPMDRMLRLLLVTPDMHRVHHSVIIRETNSNFGFNFSWWDRIFSTYQEQPQQGHGGMKLGLANYRDPKWLTLQWMLLVPFMHRSR